MVVGDAAAGAANPRMFRPKGVSQVFGQHGDCGPGIEVFGGGVHGVAGLLLDADDHQDAVGRGERRGVGREDPVVRDIPDRRDRCSTRPRPRPCRWCCRCTSAGSGSNPSTNARAVTGGQ
ncbi:hypothetical protein ACGFZB_25120 [Streptomyces cinerochromogenes]|uniref:Uncharacterized protein n=1 Tax=Streptomyces cinerochromogenes TaxID=66422 RepID=A0ABW7BDB4_9ACTN